MGDVHELIQTQGRQAALLADVDRRVIDVASAYMGDEDSGVGFLYTGWCQAALPHRRLPDAQGWQIETDRITLIVEPGMRPGSGGIPIPTGVPYGSRARLILIYLQTEALRTGSREVELGRSLRAWLARMDIPIGGRSAQQVRDQAERISRCRMSFNIRQGTRVGMINQSIMETAIFLDDHGDQGSLFIETARISQAFFDQLRKHPMPVEEAAIRAISNNSMGLDIYCWLAYRLHALPSQRPVTWASLKTQFGQGFIGTGEFRRRFRDNLALALAVYPAAKVDADTRGLTLHPSPPPVQPRLR